VGENSGPGQGSGDRTGSGECDRTEPQVREDAHPAGKDAVRSRSRLPATEGPGERTAATAGSCGRLLGHFQTEELPGESG
jgi:hypothetical protein